MPDLVIREKDGWIEISEIVDELGPVSKQELWEHAGEGNIAEVSNLLDMELGDLMEEKIGTAEITHLTVISMPDDLKGERLRAWIKIQPIETPAPPSGGSEVARPVDVELELEMARNVFGKLKAREKARLRAVLYQPNEETWSDAHGIIVGADRWTTLWQAVLAVDPTFPKTGPVTTSRGGTVKRWARIPSQQTLIAALRYATH